MCIRYSTCASLQQLFAKHDVQHGQYAVSVPESFCALHLVVHCGEHWLAGKVWLILSLALIWVTEILILPCQTVYGAR